MTNSIRKALFICIVASISCSYAQQGDVLPSSGMGGSSADSPIMSEQFRMQLSADPTNESIEFFYLTYRTPTIDLRRIKTYTQYDIPESVVITPPNLSGFDHTTVLVGVYGSKSDPRMIIWLAGNYHYDRVTFFMDYDQNRNFADDKPPISMRSGSDPKEVILTPSTGEQHLWLTVPKQEAKIKKPKVRIVRRIAVGVHAGIGSGQLSYTATGHPDYYVNISEKNIGLAASYYTKYAVIGATASFQNHYFYASYQGNTLNVNRDEHTPNKLQLGLFAAARIPLSNYVEIQPYVKYGGAQYSVPHYKESRYSDESFELDFSRYYEVGMRFEFTVGDQNAFFLEYGQNRQKWEPRGLPATESSDFDPKFKIGKFNLGYTVTF